MLVSRIGNGTLLRQASWNELHWTLKGFLCHGGAEKPAAPVFLPPCGLWKITGLTSCSHSHQRSHYCDGDERLYRRRPNMNPAGEEGDSPFSGCFRFHPPYRPQAFGRGGSLALCFQPPAKKSSSSSCFLLEAMLCWSLSKFGGGSRRPRLVSEDRIDAQEKSDVIFVTSQRADPQILYAGLLDENTSQILFATNFFFPQILPAAWILPLHGELTRVQFLTAPFLSS